MAIKYPSATHRGQKIIEMVYRHRCLSRVQILKLLSISPTYGSKCLSALCRDRYLVRKYAQSFTTPHSFAYYQLDTQGALTIESLLGEVKWQPRDNHPPYTQHHWEVNNLAIEMVQRWSEESQFFSEQLMTIPFKHRGQEWILKPDGALLLNQGPKQALVFLERERSLQRQKHFFHKVAMYTAFADGPVAKHFFGRTNFLVWVICNSQSHCQRLQEWAQSQGTSGLFGFSPLDIALSDPVKTLIELETC